MPAISGHHLGVPRVRKPPTNRAAANVKGLEALYAKALPANRSGSLYGAFPYPTKISPEAIAIFIAAHTNAGDTVFDGFAGSGTGGLAALLCENPPDELREEAKRLGLNAQWGARNAILYELGALGAFVSRTLTNPPEPRSFRKAAEEILDAAETAEGWMYSARGPDGNDGVIRYLIWSDLLLCPECNSEITMWDACVSRNPAQMSADFTCPACSHKAPLDDVSRLTQTLRDDRIGKPTRLRIRRPVCVHGTTGKTKWSRPITDQDLKLLDRVAKQPLPDSIPRVEIPWGDLYRKGYHQGITHLHHFYTRRNLIVFGQLWNRTEHYQDRLRDALRFWLLSYNASHATIMTRVVAKSGQKDLVLTSAQPGVLYVSGLPVEKNLVAGLRRKLSTITDAFTIVRDRKARVDVYQQSSCRTHLPDQSIDYIFTDPPFGGNIPYAEINFINEAWLNHYTDQTEEIIISKHQKKGLTDYQALLTAALSEMRRILKSEGKVTLVFHSASAEVWNALQAAYEASGFSVECAGVLHKTQGSFKQVTTEGAVRGDPVLLLGKPAAKAKHDGESVWKVARRLTQEAASTLDPVELTAQRLYSRLVTHYLSHHRQVPLDADSFYRWHAQQSSSENIAGARN
jgi:predicted RNA methylase